MNRRSFFTSMLALAGAAAAFGVTTRQAEAFTVPPPAAPTPIEPEAAVLGEGDAPEIETVQWRWRRPRRRVIIRRRPRIWRRPRRRVVFRRRAWGRRWR